ncbi:hypothetical protein [Azohydromonas lata]|uniref:Holin n=1 Tax=Azohydromonas lata TaxID=45677 RepID=A0ABU5IAM7_9BURK|nr:hypothetical protein [Azohydromonas lata]MDZ5455661.1 hypothetical protein [Azohydromonas lata]
MQKRIDATALRCSPAVPHVFVFANNQTPAMCTNSSTPMQQLTDYAAVFVAGILAANIWRWHGQYMREAGRQDAKGGA